MLTYTTNQPFAGCSIRNKLITLVPAFWRKGCFRTRLPSILHHLSKVPPTCAVSIPPNQGLGMRYATKCLLVFQPFSSLTSEEMRTYPIQALTPTWVQGRINMDKYDPGKFLGKF
jgi:hypothetical protein